MKTFILFFILGLFIGVIFVPQAVIAHGHSCVSSDQITVLNKGQKYCDPEPSTEPSIEPSPEVTPEVSPEVTPTEAPSAGIGGDAGSDGNHTGPDGRGCAIQDCSGVIVPNLPPRTGR